MSGRNDGNELWFCHECHAETRPLMVPTPHCAACNSDFVEKIEHSGGEDDPREYMQGAGVPGDLDVFGTLLAGMLMGGPSARPAHGRTLGGGGGGSGMRFELRTGGSGGTSSRTFVLGGPNTLGGGQRDDGQPPLLAPFLDEAFRHDFGDERPNADRARDGRQRMPMHPLFNPAILALLGGHPAFAGLHNGQMGDYVLDQESMDQILTQLMEAGNPHRPVPAPEDQISHLPRRKVNVQNYLDANEEMRNRECAVCKDSLLPSPDSSETEVQLVKLPCVHEFHEDCIVPWLKNSGTCPVCRHQLVAQPAAHDHAPPPQQAQEHHERSERGPSVPSIPGLRTLGNLASNVYNQFRHPGSSSHAHAANTNNPAGNDPGEPSSSSSAPPQSAGSSSGTFGRRTPSPTADFYPMTPGSGPRQYSPRPPRRTNSGGYVLGSSPPRSASPETRRPYAFAPPRELYNPWDTAPNGSRSPTAPGSGPGSGGQRSPRDGRSPGHSRRSSGNGNANGGGNSSNRPRSPGAFPGGWHDLD